MTFAAKPHISFISIMEVFDKQKLIGDLILKGYLKTKIIIKAFRKVDRKDFVAPEFLDLAYVDEAMPIGYGQTISQPLTVAFMLELLEPKPGEKILDVGSGSGWTTALLAYCVSQAQINADQNADKRGKKDGLVIGVEKIPELVEFGRKNLAKYELPQASISQAGAELGLPGKASFDRILVSATAEELPQELVNQLKVGGRIVIPIRNSIWKVDKISEQKLKKEEYFGFSFVPLVSGN